MSQLSIFGNLSNLFSTQVKSIFLLWTNLITRKAGVRVSSNLENMENLKMSGNLKVGPKSQGKVEEFFENAKLYTKCHIVVKFLQTSKNAFILARLQSDRENQSGKVREMSGNFLSHGGWTPCGV